MSQGQGLTQEQLGVLFAAASAKLGKDPAQLKEAFSQGTCDQALAAIGGDREKLRTMLENRAAMEELLRTPQVKDMLEGLMGGKK